VLAGAARTIPGRATRLLWFGVMVASAATLAVVLVHGDGSWSSHELAHDGHPPALTREPR
jgi:hypothetical protein